MKVKIYYTLPDDNEDSFVLSGTIEDIKAKAEIELTKRGAVDRWSEVLEE